jgi:hypothetical protein
LHEPSGHATPPSGRRGGDLVNGGSAVAPFVESDETRHRVGFFGDEQLTAVDAIDERLPGVESQLFTVFVGEGFYGINDLQGRRFRDGDAQTACAVHHRGPSS